MKKIKKTLSAILFLTCMIGTNSILTFAYTDGDREVKYYDFSFGSGEGATSSSSSMKRLYDREWVVTVESRANNKYAITYAMVDNNGTEWENALVSNVAKSSGTGNFGGTYYSSKTIGKKLYLGGAIDPRDINARVTSSGQWSTDAHK